MTAYVYQWTHKPTGKWYIGVRWRKGCHPDDGYICSSRTVRPMIEANPEQWQRQILATGTPEEMRKRESDLLRLYNARDNAMSFNQHNQQCPTNGGRRPGKRQPHAISRTHARLIQQHAQDYAQYPDLTPRAIWQRGNNAILNDIANETDGLRRFLYILCIMDLANGEAYERSIR